MFTRHNPPSPSFGRRKCHNVPEHFAGTLFNENACVWCLALVAWGPFTFWGGGLWRFKICMKDMEKREPALAAPSRGGGLEKGLQRPLTPPKNHLEERLLDQAQARASYTPLFWGHSRSIPQGMILDDQPLVQSLFCPIRASPNGFFDFEASTP